ncbi:MAG: sigma-70 family RNA polymerase sigma factor [Bacteroidales bacterium]|nr:sigma-70 family RNA polymerase sigma factor [Bacteroidales bacterium]
MPGKKTTNKTNSTIIMADKSSPEKFTRLMEENMDFAHHIAKRFFNDPAEAQDAIQNAFIKAWQSFGNYKADQALFSTWFYSIIRNECIDRIRSKNRNIHIPLNETDLSGFAQEQQSLDELDLYQRVIIMADHLPPSQKETFLLRDIEGFSIREVIKETGQTEGSVKTNLYLARKKIRQWLKNLDNKGRQ